jgi:uncharacterized protein
MSKPFLGIGISYPVELDNTGALKLSPYEESVRQSIWLILGTAKGERLMRPNFGCGIYDLVFEVNTPSTAGKIADAVQESLLLHEPRIEVVNVQVSSISDEEGEKLLISIDYQIRATNTVFNLVYPFYLERSAG